MVKQSAEAPDVFLKIFPLRPNNLFYIRSQITVVLNGLLSAQSAECCHGDPASHAAKHNCRMLPASPHRRIVYPSCIFRLRHCRTAEFPLPIIISIHHDLMVRVIPHPIKTQISPVNIQQDIISLFNILPDERDYGVLHDFRTPVFIKIQKGTLVEHIQPAFPILYYTQFIKAERCVRFVSDNIIVIRRRPYSLFVHSVNHRKQICQEAIGIQ